MSFSNPGQEESHESKTANEQQTHGNIQTQALQCPNTQKTSYEGVKERNNVEIRPPVYIFWGQFKLRLSTKAKTNELSPRIL